MKQTPNLQGLGFLLVGRCAHPAGGPPGACQARKGPAGSSREAGPSLRGQWSCLDRSLSGARGRRAHSLYSVTCPHKPWRSGPLGLPEPGSLPCGGSGTKGVHGQLRFIQEAPGLTSSAVPKWQTPRSLRRSLLGPLRLIPPGLQRERQAARWQRIRVHSDGRGPGTRGRVRAGAQVSVQPLPTTPGLPGQAGGEQAGWPLPEFQAGSVKAKGPPPRRARPPIPGASGMDGRGLMATGASQMDPLVPVDLVGEHTAQTEGAVQCGLIERHGTLARAAGRLCLFHHGFGEERDSRGL